MKFEEKNFVIIIGQPKAGTTSLFNWLGSHPDVCPSTFKEARFFLDDDYPLPRPFGYKGDNLSDYAKLFPCQDKDVLLEGSPDYLYNQTPLKVAKLLPNAKVVVIVRDSIERLASAYRYFQQRGAVPMSMTFSEYITYQMDHKVDSNTPVHFRSLEHCRVNKYLQLFRDAFEERYLEIEFSDLKADPYGVVDRVCGFAGISAKYYQKFKFAAENETCEPRFQRISRLFHYIRTSLAHRLAGKPGFRQILRPISILIQKVISKKTSSIKPIVSDREKEIIVNWLQSN